MKEKKADVKYTKELVCMNCGKVDTFQIPFGTPWKEYVSICSNCGCANFSDYYKNIQNFRPRRFSEFDDLWMENKEQKHMLECIGVDVEPLSHDPAPEIRKFLQSEEGQTMLRDNITPEIHRQLRLYDTSHRHGHYNTREISIL